MGRLDHVKPENASGNNSGQNGSLENDPFQLTEEERNCFLFVHDWGNMHALGNALAKIETRTISLQEVRLFLKVHEELSEQYKRMRLTQSKEIIVIESVFKSIETKLLQKQV